MKKILSYILTVVVFSGMPLTFVFATNCIPNFRGDYTVEANCTWPGNYTVRGNIYVGSSNVTVPNGGTIGIDLAVQRVTFTTGRINFQGLSNMNYTNSNGFYISMSHNPTSNFRNCPSGMRVLNMSPNGYQGSSVTARPTSGVFYCGK